MTSLKAAHKIVIGQSKKNFEMDEEDIDRIKEDMARMTAVTT